ncbi:MAG: hypothetical protein SWH68_16590 [Thermodesulfobacteriota bacterium]|nr:hypothetical protein [Thermodesulfobacteriota bacterium]
MTTRIHRYSLFLIFFFIFPAFLSGCRSDAFVDVKNYIYEHYVFESDSGFSVNDIHVSIDSSNGKFAVITKPEVPEWPQSLADMAYVMCIRKTEGKWQVVYDLTRSDVPSGAELKHIKTTFPEDFPRDLLPRYWQKKLED